MQCIFDGPSCVQSLNETVIRLAIFFCPCRYALCSAVVCEQPQVASISRLLDICRPYRILGRIRSIIVETLQGVIGARSIPHVGPEVLKDLPSVTDSNTSTSISRKGMVIDVATSFPHADPDGIGRCLLTGFGLSVTGGASLSGLITQTAARLRFVSQQVIFADHSLLSTEATTEAKWSRAIWPDTVRCDCPTRILVTDSHCGYHHDITVRLA